MRPLSPLRRRCRPELAQPIAPSRQVLQVGAGTVKAVGILSMPAPDTVRNSWEVFGSSQPTKSGGIEASRRAILYSEQRAYSPLSTGSRVAVGPWTVTSEHVTSLTVASHAPTETLSLKFAPFVVEPSSSSTSSSSVTGTATERRKGTCAGTELPNELHVTRP